MPRLPQPTAQGRNAILQLPTPSGESFGVQAGQSVRQFGLTLQGVGEKIQAQRDETDVISKVNDYKVRLAQLPQEILNDQTVSPENRLTEYKTRAEAFRGTLSEGTNPTVQRVLTNHTANLFADGLIHMQTEDLKEQVQTERVKLTNEQMRMAELEAGHEALGDFWRATAIRQERQALLSRAEGRHILNPTEAQIADRAAIDRKWQIVATKNPDLVMQIYKDVQKGLKPPADMDTTQLDNYTRLANMAQTMERAEAERKRAEVARLKQAEYQSTAQALTGKYALHEGNPLNPALTVTEVGQAMIDDKLDDPVGRALLGMIRERATGAAIKTDYDAYWRLFNRIHAPVGDPNRITDLAPIYEAGGVKRQLSPPDLERLRKEFVDSRDEVGQKLGVTKTEFLTKFKPAIDTSIVGQKLDPRGSELFGDFQYLVNQEVERYTKENKDPAMLFNPDPNNAEYLGRQVSRFTRTPQQQIKDMADRLRGAQTITEPAPNIVVPNPDKSQWGARTDGTAKGEGFFGVLKRPDGKVSSELSTDDPIENGGKPVLHPLIVPTLSRPELDYLLAGRTDNQVMEAKIYEKAAAHARSRLAAGKSPFAGPGEKVVPPSNAGWVPSEKQRKAGEDGEAYWKRMEKQ